MKNILIALMAIISMSLSNCKKDPSKGADVSTLMDIAFKSSGGSDLLNPSTPNYFSPSSIHVYVVVKGIKKEVYNPMMDYPQNFLIYKVDSLNLYRIRVFFETDTTLLQLNSSITDTLVCTFDRSNGNWRIRKFWYNGVLKWDNVLYPQEITIIK